MKTRSNMPLFVVETDNVKALSNSQIDLLRCGDYLVKKDASGEHAYKVTYKSDTGMCLTYMDASVIETQSYDKVDGNWVYNSEDKTIIAEPQLENIVDKDGHKRFIEGDIDVLEDNLPEGNEVKYAKWSLSGSHLMIVFYEEILQNSYTSAVYPTVFAEIKLPKWILDKIISNNSYYVGAPSISISALASTGSTFETVRCGLRKQSDKLELVYDPVGSPITTPHNSSGRLTFDLLIDNE